MGRITKHYTASVIIPWIILEIGLIHGEIYIPSRGRSGAIHQFYDQRVQALRPYMLVDMDNSNSYISNNPRGGSTLKRTVTKTYSEYVEKLEIDGESKLDLLLNIFEAGVHGQGSYTKIERQTSSSIFAFVEIIQHTREEKTDLCDPKWIQHLQFPLLQSEHVQATHIIKGKLYGLYLEIILEIHESEEDSNSNLELDVRAELDSFLARLDLSSSTSKTSVSKKYLSKSKILTYCNLINCPTPPQNLDQLEQFIKNSISTLTLNEDTQGNEIALIADDIRSLTECWNATIDHLNNKTKMHELSGQNVNLIESVIRDIEEGVAEINSFYKKMEVFKECVPETVMSDIRISSIEAMSFANTFKAKLKKFVIYVRFASACPVPTIIVFDTGLLEKAFLGRYYPCWLSEPSIPENQCQQHRPALFRQYFEAYNRPQPAVFIL
ncbi:unnamed protein product [Allacma fusca]|uniref:Uncharacterized protein n=1 Tax=Allacma fusca TaxID=39272 RepID=A0A8J2PI05_9HEXA|nr:unnamed protein product [Allacma fusca]